MIEVDVLSMGYGTVGKLVMRDRDLAPEAKVIYAYISTYAGAGDTAYPSVDLICYDMNMGKDRFQKHKKCLIDKGYIIIQKYATAEGKFTNNLYVKKNTVMREAKATDDKATAIELPLPDFTAEAIPAPLWSEVIVFWEVFLRQSVSSPEERVSSGKADSAQM